MIFTDSYPSETVVQSHYFLYCAMLKFQRKSSFPLLYASAIHCFSWHSRLQKRRFSFPSFFFFLKYDHMGKSEAESQLYMQQSHCSSIQVSDLCLGFCRNQPFQIKATGFPNELSLKLIWTMEFSVYFWGTIKM